MIQHKYTLTYLPFLLFISISFISIPLSTVAQISGDEKKKINRPYSIMIDAYKKLDANIIRNAYTDSAYYLRPSRRDSIRVGIDSFITDFESMFAQHKKVENEIQLSFKILNREHCGNIAVDVGYYKISILQQNGIERTSFGKFMTFLKRKDENAPWKFAADGYSFSPPVDF